MVRTTQTGGNLADIQVAGATAGGSTRSLTASDQLFIAMYKRTGFGPEAAQEIFNTEHINTMIKLERITEDRASRICKAIRFPGGGGFGAHVTKGAEHNLVISVRIALN